MTEKDLFFEALDFAEPERAAFLDRVCANDPDKRKRLERLLANHFQSDAFMEVPAVEESRASAGHLADLAGTTIGRYKLLELIGEGGFGSVYLAEQGAPVRRKVALKIIKLGMDTRQVVARFAAEQQALAVMEHPNIAKVLDAGATESGRPFFVMELVRGERITDYCAAHQLSIPERLKLFVQVCHAIQHAHQKGIIHRDIKPSNIVIAQLEGAPSPKVIDFGIAKAIEGDLASHTVFTHLHQFIGTPAYMSPEQAEMTALNVDTRTDIYALGAVLYELLTGVTPFDAKELASSGLDEMRRVIREKDPARPSTRLTRLSAETRRTGVKSPGIDADLDWIVLKCLEKDRARRYDSVGQLASDIQRYLANQTVSARPPTALYKLHKFARRNRAAALIISIIVASLVGGIVLTTRQAAIARRAQAEAVSAKEQETRERLRADAQKSLAERNFYLASMALAQIASGRNQLAAIAQNIEETASNPHRAFEWYYHFRSLNRHTRSLRGHAPGGVRVEWLPDGRRLVSAGYDGKVRMWDVSTGRELHAFTGHNARIHALAISPNGKLIATSGDDHTARVWEADTGKELFALQHPGIVWYVTFSPDSQSLVTAEHGLVLWDANTGARVRELGVASRATFSPDSTRLAKSGGRQIFIHDAISDERIGQDSEVRGWISTMTYSPDGTKIFAGYDDGSIQVVDGRTGQRLALWQGHSGTIVSGVFTPDGRTFASSEGNDIVFWDASTYERKFTIKAGAVIAFSPDGGELVGACGDGSFRFWLADESSSGDPVRLAAGGLVFSARFSGDGEHVLTSSGGLWDVRSQNQVAVFNSGEHLSSSRYFPDFTRVATISGDGIARIWDTKTRRELLRFEGHPKEQLYTLAISPDGKQVFTASSPQSWAAAVNLTGKLWDAQSGEEVLTLAGTGRWAAFFPDGRRLATGSDKGCNIWNLATGQVERTFPGFGGAVAVSSDGRRIVIADDRRAQIWNSETGAAIAALQGHTGYINSVAFSHDDRRIVTGGDDDTVRLWDAETGKETLTLSGGRGRISTVEFSRDDQRILAAAGDQVVIWEAASPEEVARVRGMK